MPNWCSNSVTIRHSNAREIERVIAAFTQHGLLNEFVPGPADLQAEKTGFANAEVKAERMSRYGYESWHDWSTQHWGTKSDIGGDDTKFAELDEHTVIMDFESEWSPPLEALRTMESQGFEIMLMWDEPSMAFCGWYVTGGSEDIFNYQTWNAATAQQRIPEKINDKFKIVERILSYEQETKNDTD
jgi:hypothetical protein